MIVRYFVNRAPGKNACCFCVTGYL